MRSWLRPGTQPFEVVLAVALAAAAQIELWTYGLRHGPAQAGVAALVALPLAVRFRWPLGTLIVVSVASAVESAAVDNQGQVMVPVACVLLALYAVGSRRTGWRFWAGGLIAGIGVALGMLVRQGVTSDLALAVAFPAAGLLIGRALGVLRLETDVLEERATELERERDRHAQLAVEEERSRIARELHDVIGHSISVMGVQAGGVRRLLRPEQERERAALIAVERSGRDAVGEMRRLIGLLRAEDDLGGPSPSLARIESLADEMRAAGLRLDLRTEGPLEHLPPGVDLAGYRIVQEALTNALKHAAGSNVSAVVCSRDDVLRIDVLDDAPHSLPATKGRVGHGLLGMRERAALYNGELTAEPLPGAGFGVRARIPLERT